MGKHQRIGIVGGGILGLATARKLASDDPGANVTVLEKEAAVARHQTGRNSGVVHAGIYYPPGSLKAALCVRGVASLRDYCERNRLPYEECGKVIVASTDDEVPKLRDLLERGRGNGVADLRWLDGHELAEVEPNVVGVAGVHSPHTAIVDFVAIARRMAADVAEAGGVVRTGARLDGVSHRGDEVWAHTTVGTFAFDRLITCAGLHSDRVARLAGDGADPMIVPFRGEYMALRPERTHLVRGLIYPVPDPRYPFLGVHLTKQIDGGVTVGPNAVLAFAREGYRFTDVRAHDLAEILRWPGFWRFAAQHWRTGLDEYRRSLSRRLFIEAAQAYVPALEADDVVPHPAGVRAQAVGSDGALVEDFRITHTGRVTNVRNAPSPAATSSLAIAEHIAQAFHAAQI